MTPTPLPNMIEGRRCFADRYRLVRQCGVGGMGVVYEALDSTLNDEPVALKIVHNHLISQHGRYASFCSEVLIARRLTHPNIVQIYGYGLSPEGLPYCTMELVDGCTLKDRIAGPAYSELSLETLLEYLAYVAHGLSYAHRKGVIHRDLKPQNVLLGSDGTVKIADFGLSQLLLSALERERTNTAFAGTPHYMSPEQIRGEMLDERSDVYSFGIMAYEVLTGRLPYDDSSLFMLAQQHLNEPISFHHEARPLPAWLQTFLQRCTAKDRNERFASAEELYSELGTYAAVSHTVATSDDRVAPLTLPEGPRKRAFDEKTIKLGRRIFAFLAAFCFIGYILTDKPLYLVSVPIAFICRSSLRWNRRLQLAIVAFFLLVVPIASLRIVPSLNKRAVAVLLYCERTVGIELSPARRFLGTTLKGTIEEVFASFPNDRYALYSLIHSGMDLRATDANNNTPLHYAAKYNQDRAVLELLAAGLDPLARNDNNETPLELSLNTAGYGVAEAMLKMIPSQCSPDAPYAPLNRLIARGDATAVKLLLQYNALTDPICREIYRAQGLDPLEQAKEQNRVEVYELIRAAMEKED